MPICSNPLLNTDVYKMGHLLMYPPDLTKIYSYMIARRGEKYPKGVFFGAQYYIQEYLQHFPTLADVNEFMALKERILGPAHSDEVRNKLESLVELGYWPLKIESVLEGTVVDHGNVLMTFENTHPDFPWVVGFLESLFLKIWNTTTVATFSSQFRNIANHWADVTCNRGHVPYQVHDFGYRGCSSEETALVSGMSHLVAFNGSDTVPAIWGIEKYYDAPSGIGVSVPATEHSVMCSYGIDGEYDAFDSILHLYPNGILSVVSDTYNLWNILTDYASSRKDVIMGREGKLVFRPDGGFPPYIIAGDPTAATGTVERAGAIELLGNVFGYTVNDKGYKELDPHVGLIFGEGMTHERFSQTCELLEKKGWASNNFVIGVGGLLLQSHNRDHMGFALKAIYAERNGIPMNLMKNPITSQSKRSHSGLLALEIEDGTYVTHPREANEPSGLETLYTDGVQHYILNLGEIRERVANTYGW